MKHSSGGLRHFVRENRFALLVAAGWFVLLWGLVLAGNYFYKEPFALDLWAGSWDGAWYRSIVEGGYHSGPIDRQVNVAFFPLYPSLVWLVSKVTLLPPIWAGMLVSSVSFAAALVAVWHFVSKFFTRKIAVWTLLLIAFNPWSLYFGMMYTESLFLLLAVTAFWFVYTKQWWGAAFFAGLATATRSVGIAVAISVIVAWLAESLRKKHVKPVQSGWRAAGNASSKVAGQQTTRVAWSVWIPKTIALVVLSFSGAIIFSLYLWLHTGDFMAYRTAQTHWPGRGGLTNVGAELMYLWEHRIVNMEYVLTALWYVCGIMAFVGVWLVIRMRQWILALYSGIALSLPILFGTFTSMNRYAQVVFPIFIAYAAVVSRWPRFLRVCTVLALVVGLGIITFLMVDPRDLFMA
jgi:hypothetical protein